MFMLSSMQKQTTRVSSIGPKIVTPHVRSWNKSADFAEESIREGCEDGAHVSQRDSLAIQCKNDWTAQVRNHRTLVEDRHLQLRSCKSLKRIGNKIVSFCIHQPMLDQLCDPIRALLVRPILW